MDRYICVHGHFYQPPRENPWLEAVQVQDSAYPYHDWNERITAECYAPNAVSRILDDANRIVQIVNNYSRISFNFGPTLLAWLEDKAPEVYRSILEADRETLHSFSGHGSALAQPFNHMIMPLANKRDKRTQVVWGIRDFEHRFNRRPEGMWLPETAVDTETLEVLAENGIRFTILSPFQAARFRPLGAKEWQAASDGRLDPTLPYVMRLPSGRTINLFFYDAPLSRGVAFERLLADGVEFARRLAGAFQDERTHSQLVHIATDGESYGHHFQNGEMGLSYALHYIQTHNLARLTNYGEFLETHPPEHEVDIVENSSWSCAHGVERWRSDCGCRTGAHPGWSQAWRAPLRKALDSLRDSFAQEVALRAGEFFLDPWKARDDYISVILDRTGPAFDSFFRRHASRNLDARERTPALKLMELQRNAMLMYTSCGWFFDELSGIETVQVMRYAGRALQLAEELWGDRLEERFLKHLEEARSNLPEHGDGRRIYESFVLPAKTGLKDLAAHYGINSLFDEYPKVGEVYCYKVERTEYHSFELRSARLRAGSARFTSKITGESASLNFAALYPGDHNLAGGVSEFTGADSFNQAVHALSDAFGMTDFAQVIRMFDRYFGESTYSIRSLFSDEQRKVLGVILASRLEITESQYRQIYERHAPLMRFLSDLRMPAPQAFRAAAEFTINRDLRLALESREPDLKRIQSLLREAEEMNVTLDKTTLEFAFRSRLEAMMKQLSARPGDFQVMNELLQILEFSYGLPFRPNLWSVQNIFYEMSQRVYPGFRTRAAMGHKEGRMWIEMFHRLGSHLSVAIPLEGVPKPRPSVK